MASLTYDRYPFLKELGIAQENAGCYDGEWFGSGDLLTSISPITGEPICRIKSATKDDYERLLTKMTAAIKHWQATPAPIRGEVVRSIGERLRAKKHALAKLISLEMGKILSEATGEVQEFIDICDYAAGLSRMINGVVIPSERPGHVIQEHWHPLGIVGIITAFNFPCAVFGWNIAISLVCGNVNIWKGATSTSLVTLATTRVVAEALAEHNIPGAVASTIVGAGRAIGELFLADKRLALVSFTGSTSVGTRISTAVHSRFGRTILELGGNNAIIVLDDANIELALRSTVFAAVGTTGQRCTSVRRLVLHEAIYDKFLASLQGAYKSIKIGDPLVESTLMGPLHTAAAVKEYEEGIAEAVKQGGKVIAGGHVLRDRAGFFVEPTLIAWDNNHAPILKQELFCPVLHVLKCKSVEEAIEINNSVPQGLSSSLFTNDMRKVYLWTSHAGSDCGLVNVNVPTNGAEIGGAFGGEKETGGGRESGSDSWKQYMRRATCTINYSSQLPLAQGIRFETS